MKIAAFISLLVTLFLGLTGCQQSLTREDTAKIQESIEKIKTKIQDNLANEKKARGNQENKDKL